jgi:hypothetical protein
MQMMLWKVQFQDSKYLKEILGLIPLEINISPRTKVFGGYDESCGFIYGVPKNLKKPPTPRHIRAFFFFLPI